MTKDEVMRNLIREMNIINTVLQSRNKFMIKNIETDQCFYMNRLKLVEAIEDLIQNEDFDNGSVFESKVTVVNDNHTYEFAKILKCSEDLYAKILLYHVLGE